MNKAELERQLYNCRRAFDSLLREKGRLRAEAELNDRLLTAALELRDEARTESKALRKRLGITG